MNGTFERSIARAHKAREDQVHNASRAGVLFTHSFCPEFPFSIGRGRSEMNNQGVSLTNEHGSVNSLPKISESTSSVDVSS